MIGLRADYCALFVEDASKQRNLHVGKSKLRIVFTVSQIVLTHRLTGHLYSLFALSKESN